VTKSAAKKLIVTALAVTLAGLFVRANRLHKSGRIVASSAVQIEATSHRVTVHERCTAGLFQFILMDQILRSRMSDYEYWAELYNGSGPVSRTDSIVVDSTVFDHPQIEGADSKGIVVALDPASQIYRFNWLPEGSLPQRNGGGWGRIDRPSIVHE
jgi:hypothetical protein